jgi:hypothetical protein
MVSPFPIAFGSFIKQLRLNRKVTLREHCLKHRFDPGNYSRMERGWLPPPATQTLLGKYAKALGVKDNPEIWQELIDKAAACRGELPYDLIEPAIIEKLPVIFCGLRRAISQDKLDWLVEQIRKG